MIIHYVKYYYPSQFGSDVTSATFAFNWSRGRGATLTRATRRYACCVYTEQALIYLTSLPNCYWLGLYNFHWHACTLVSSPITYHTKFENLANVCGPLLAWIYPWQITNHPCWFMWCIILYWKFVMKKQNKNKTNTKERRTLDLIRLMHMIQGKPILLW